MRTLLILGALLLLTTFAPLANAGELEAPCLDEPVRAVPLLGDQLLPCGSCSTPDWRGIRINTACVRCTVFAETILL